MTVPAVGHEDRHFWERRATEREQASAEAAGLLAQAVAHLSGIRTLMLAAPMDDVMFRGAVVVGADGTFRATFPQPFASVRVTNFAAHLLTATASAPSGAPPAQGTGVLRIPSGFARTFPLRGTSLVMWGTADDSFDVEVYLRPREPSIQACGQVA